MRRERETMKKKRLTVNLTEVCVHDIGAMADSACQSMSHVVEVAISVLLNIVTKRSATEMGDPRVAALAAALGANARNVRSNSPVAKKA
jgi:hypothetical protein